MLSREANDTALNLTDRELEVIRFVSKGLQNKDIASALGISKGTVKIHIHHIYAKLGLSSRVELAVYARTRVSGPTATRRLSRTKPSAPAPPKR